MKLRIIKIDGEFVIVELEDGEQKVCPSSIFPKEITTGSTIKILITSFKDCN